MTNRYIQIMVPKQDRANINKETETTVVGIEGNGCYDLTKGLIAFMGGKVTSEEPKAFEQEQEMVQIATH